MDDYRGLDSGQADDGTYDLGLKEDIDPRSWPENSYYRSKESLHLKRILVKSLPVKNIIDSVNAKNIGS